MKVQSTHHSFENVIPLFMVLYFFSRSQSKASYLSYKREPKEKEKGLPNFQGSYKRTMSPNGARITDSDTCLSEFMILINIEGKILYKIS